MTSEKHTFRHKPLFATPLLPVSILEVSIIVPSAAPESKRSLSAPMKQVSCLSEPIDFLAGRARHSCCDDLLAWQRQRRKLIRRGVKLIAVPTQPVTRHEG